jgi:NADPH:quinone reductase
MKAILCKTYGGPDLLEIGEVSAPAAEPGKVVIRVKCCGVAFPDTLMIRNLYQFKPPLPFSPGGEVSGVVKAVGEGVRHVKPGDRVFALTGWGGFAEEVAVEALRCGPMPPGMDFVGGASFVYNYGTSYHALKDRGRLKAGETLLVLGAGGGVGITAVELGKAMGATVIAAASSEEKLAVCREKGADCTLNYNTEDLRERIKDFTAGKGVDVIFDPVGDRFAEPALRSMNWNGRYLVVGFAAGEIPKIPTNLALLKGCSIVGVFWGSFTQKEPQKSLQNIGELAQLYAQGKIRPHIYKLYPFSEGAQALRDLMDRKVVGKAVIATDHYDPVADAPIPVAKAEATQGVAVGEYGVEFDDLATLKTWFGKTIGPSPWLETTQEMVNNFAAATLDFQWIHLDIERAQRESPFGAPVAHGLLSLSLLPYFMYGLVKIKSAKLFVNYGYNKVRMISPVPVGSRIRASAVLTGMEDGPNGTKLFIENTIEIEGGTKPVCVAESIGLVFESN